MTYKLFLDDIRFPKNDSWIIVRTCQEAIQYVNDHGVPNEMSLDHDLGEGQQDAPVFLHWMIDQHLDGRFDITKIDFNVHSANPSGVLNLNGLWNSFIKFAGSN